MHNHSSSTWNVKGEGKKAIPPHKMKNNSTVRGGFCTPAYVSLLSRVLRMAIMDHENHIIPKWCVNHIVPLVTTGQLALGTKVALSYGSWLVVRWMQQSHCIFVLWTDNTNPWLCRQARESLHIKSATTASRNSARKIANLKARTAASKERTYNYIFGGP